MIKPDINLSIAEQKTALNVCFKIMFEWDISEANQRDLLGKPDSVVFKQWQEKDVRGSLQQDVLLRASCIIKIYKHLHIIFPSKQQANDWILKPNSMFNQQTALKVIISEEIAGLQKIESYLKSQLI